MKAIAIDIETVAPTLDDDRKDLIWKRVKKANAPKSYKNESAIAVWRNKRYAKECESEALHPTTGEIVCITVGLFDTVDLITIDPIRQWLNGEHDCLVWIDDLLSKYNPDRIYTFNGRRFDLPFIRWRMAINGVVPIYTWPWRKYDPRHIDIMDLAGKGSLDTWVTAVCGESKGSGQQIQGFYEAGEIDKIAGYARKEMELFMQLIEKLGSVYPSGMPEAY